MDLLDDPVDASPAEQRQHFEGQLEVRFVQHLSDRPDRQPQVTDEPRKVDPALVDLPIPPMVTPNTGHHQIWIVLRPQGTTPEAELQSPSKRTRTVVSP